MSLFGNKPPVGERTAEERERERIERERRRANRRGEPAAAGPEPAPVVPEPPASEPPPPAPEPPPPVPEPAPAPAPEPEPVAHEPASAAVAPELAPATAAHTAASAPVAQTRAGAVARATERRHHLPPMPHLLHRDGGRRGSGRAATAAPEAPRRRLRGRIVAVPLLIVAAVLIWFLVSLFQPFHGGGSGTVVVDVPRGAGARAIGDELARDHVVASGFFFSLRATLAGKRGSFRAGQFTLKRDMSYGAALTALTSDNRATAATRHVLVPEGYTRVQIAELAKADGLRGSYRSASTRSPALDPAAYGGRGAPSLEGFLYPATYDLAPGAAAAHLVELQLAAFKRNFAGVDLTYARRKKLTPYDVLIIASMVEREAALASERPLIAAVIYNRLHQRMPLGIDATIRYAFNSYTQPLTAAQLASRSPYNTRLRLGLPPTPIGNPGLAAINAAAHPANVPYLYYVVKPGTCGQDAFSSTNAQFQQDVARYNSARAKAGGRSPTTCH